MRTFSLQYLSITEATSTQCSMAPFKTAEEILYQWVTRVCSGKPDEIAALYNEHAVLVPTFSPHTVIGPEKITEYFRQLATREGMGVRLHSKALRIQSQSDSITPSAASILLSLRWTRCSSPSHPVSALLWTSPSRSQSSTTTHHRYPETSPEKKPAITPLPATSSSAAPVHQSSLSWNPDGGASLHGAADRA